MKKFRKYIKVVACMVLLMVLFMILSNIIVKIKSDKYIYDEVDKVPKCYTAIVLGAKVKESGVLSTILQDRMDVAIELYHQKKINRFLLSGDHGRVNYDEVNSMKKYLITHGIDTMDIFLDHAGFDTYNSMVRAKKIFLVKNAIIVSQNFHLGRAIYIARSKGIEAYGIKADKRKYVTINYLWFREIFARCKAFMEVLLNEKPKYLGKQIPITGNSNLSFD